VGDEADGMRVALVAGATRGAGRAIAVELARAGFFVYASGRSSRTSGPSELGRPETIEETGDLIRAAGGAGAVSVVDHEDPGRVDALVAGIDGEHGRLDVLVNAEFRRNVGFYYDLVKANVERIVKGLTAELEDHPVTAVGVTPGWLRSERMLENFGVTEATWREACARIPGFAISESPTYVARGVVALARADDADRWAGTIISSRQLADAYGITDTDGSRPDCWGYLAAYGWEREDGAGIDDFR
jgi:NAD(P)-dependent dehydrogenase (short-subunit alcohol dehydrogenase family)